MRAGKLDREIEIRSLALPEPDDYGVVDPEAATVTSRTVRAEVLQASTEEYLRGYGEGENASVIFRIRYLVGATPEWEVLYEGRKFNIREIKEIGRRKGLELRCEEVRT